MYSLLFNFTDFHTFSVFSVISLIKFCLPKMRSHRDTLDIFNDKLAFVAHLIKLINFRYQYERISITSRQIVWHGRLIFFVTLSY